MTIFPRRTPDAPPTPPAPDKKGSSPDFNTDPTHQEELRRIYTERRDRVTADLNMAKAAFETAFQVETTAILAAHPRNAGESNHDWHARIMALLPLHLTILLQRAKALKTQEDSLFAILDQSTLPELPKNPDLTEASLILGDHLITPADLKDAYGWDIPPTSIPPIPFTKETLEHAKAKGSYLILHLDTDPTTGKPLTIEHLNSLVQPKLTAQGAGTFINNPQASEDFYIKEKPRAGWVLVEKEVLQNFLSSSTTTPESSLSKDYTQQTRLLREYAKTLPNLTPQEQAAIDRCTDQWLAAIEPRTNSNDEKIRKPAAQELAQHPLNQLFRNRACETLQTMATLFLTRNIRHLEGKYDWGNSIWASGLLASVGFFYSQGANLVVRYPWDAGAYTGVVPSRRVSP